MVLSKSRRCYYHIWYTDEPAKRRKVSAWRRVMLSTMLPISMLPPTAPLTRNLVHSRTQITP
jgi:hypothetical protein